MNFKTLMFRINLMTVVYGIIIILISSGIMYSIVSELISNRIQEDIMNDLVRSHISLESDIHKLDSVSLLFTAFGNLGESMLRFKQIEEVGEKSILMTKIKADMNVIDFSNPDINLCLFYVNEDFVDFIATSVVNDIDFNELPNLFKDDTNTYYGPHRTAKTFSSETVLSVKRNVNMGTNFPTYVYVECNFNNTVNAMKSYQNPEEYINLLISSNNEIVYSTDEKLFQAGQVFDEAVDEKVYVKYELEDNSSTEIRIVTLANSSALNNLKKNLILEYLTKYPIFLLTGILFSLLLVNSIARPLRKFQEGLKQLEKGDFDTLLSKTHIHEFDILITQIHKAKVKISMLIDEVKEKEKKRAFAEVSRLRAQINPHFILNTLNTIHWMAIEKKQMEIDSIILALTKILAYNLKKDDFGTTIGEELVAAEEYIKLQQLKYELNYRVINEAGEEIYEYEMPRFILQPIIENSILHGKEINISIDICISAINDGVLISIKDSGGKIDEDSLNYINHYKEKPEMLGIGLSYVFSAIQSYYHRDDLITFLDIDTGLEIQIVLPFEGSKENV